MEFQPKRRTFSIIRERQELEQVLVDLPDKEEVRLFSFGGFSSLAFIFWVADRARIKSLDALTLTVGKKHITAIDTMHTMGLIDNARFIVGNIAKQSKASRDYGYYDALLHVCSKNGWKVYVSNNHAKVFLMDTDSGKFVLETSSNLNENPKMEQFVFLRDDSVYGHYQEIIGKILGN